MNANAQIHTINSERDSNNGTLNTDISKIPLDESAFDVNNFRELKKVWDKIEKGINEKTSEKADLFK
jgi:hypothetical protein